MKARELALLALVLAGQLAARWPFRHVPFVRDEGEYVHLGREILRGAVPYLDVYNQKTPFVFYWMAGCLELFGRSVEAVRLATTAYALLTTVVVFLLARSLFGARAALFAAAAFAVMSFDQCGIVHAASTECFLLLWLAAGTWLWLDGVAAASPARLLLAGVCAGLAYQTKQSGLALALFFGAEAAWRWLLGARDRASLARGAKAVGLAALGFGIVLAATLAFFAAQGALDAYIEATWSHNREYVGRRELELATLPGRLGHVLRLVARWDVGFWVLGATSLAALAIRAPRAPAGGLWLLLAATACVALAAGKLYAHYFEPLILPLALGVGAGCAWLARAVREQGRGPWRALLAAGLLAPWLWPAQHLVENLRDPAATVARELALLPPAGTAQAVAAYVAARTAPDEPILVLGSEPQIYFYADRPASSRMAHTYLLTGPYTFARRERARFLEDLRERGPRYVVMVGLPTSLSEFADGAAGLAREARAVLRERYVLERDFPASVPGARGGRRVAEAGLQVFRRKASP